MGVNHLEGSDTGPDLLRGGAEKLEGVQKLLQLTVSWEQGLLQPQGRTVASQGSITVFL